MLLTVEGLYKSFKDVGVLENINFQVDKGEIVALLGQSGAGKTTIIRCLTGLEKADRGSIAIDGKYLCKEENGKSVYPDKATVYAIRKSLGMVFQSYHLFPHMTVLENVTLALTQVHKMSGEEAGLRGTAFLRKLGLGEKLKANPYELSGGQKQRAAIARSCVTNPKLLCFDEPTAALDPETTKDMTVLIRELAREGMGILIISHDIPFVEEVSDRILRVSKGTLHC